MPPRGGDLWLQKGTLGAAMRLEALSRATPEMTRHPKTSRQPKNKQNPKQIDPNPHNPMPACNGASTSPHTSAIRGKLEGPWRAFCSTWTCLNPIPPTPYITHETNTHAPIPTETGRPIQKHYSKREVWKGTRPTTIGSPGTKNTPNSPRQPHPPLPPQLSSAKNQQPLTSPSLLGTYASL